MFTRFIFTILAIVILLRLIKIFRQEFQPTSPEDQDKKTHLPKNPWEILGLREGASYEEIKQAYHKKIAEYHPDKVAHLGKDLKELALKKSQDINWAYKKLTDKTS